jgi:hypothetical protein
MREHAHLGLPEIQEAAGWRSGPLVDSIVGFENFPGDALTGEVDRERAGIVRGWHLGRTTFSLALVVEPVSRQLLLHHHPDRWTRAEAAELVATAAGLVDSLLGDGGR